MLLTGDGTPVPNVFITHLCFIFLLVAYSFNDAFWKVVIVFHAICKVFGDQRRLVRSPFMIQDCI